MRKLISIALIFVLSGQALYKLGLVTYFQLNRTYIAEVLCVNKEKPMTMCYGNCFLKKNLKLIEETEKSSLPSQNKDNLEISSFVVSDNSYNLDQEEIELTLVHSNRHLMILNGFSSSIFHPPALA